MSWQSLIICLSIITQSMGGGLGGLTPRKVRPLIWNMVGESFSLVVIATLTVHLFGFFLPTPPSFLPLFKFQMSCWTVLMLNISIQKDISEAQAFLLHRSLPWKWLTFPSLCWRDRGRLDHCFILNCHLIYKFRLWVSCNCSKVSFNAQYIHLTFWYVLNSSYLLPTYSFHWCSPFLL